MIRLLMKNFKTILTEKLLKHQPDHQAQLINFLHLKGDEILPTSLKQIIEAASFTYSRLKKNFKEQTKQLKNKQKLLKIKEKTI